jgi:hypothetical protein
LFFCKYFQRGTCLFSAISLWYKVLMTQHLKHQLSGILYQNFYMKSCRAKLNYKVMKLVCRSQNYNFQTYFILF